MREVRVTLDAAGVRGWATAGAAALRRAQAEIDALNVYPVPDGDTGTNLYLTMRAVAEAVEKVPPDADIVRALDAMARGALMGARGNSGVILSQLLRGAVDILVDTVDAGGVLDGDALQRAFQRGAELAWRAVTHPVEGTILTVARAAAEGATGADLVSVARAAADAAAEALRHTPEQLSALADAGVVDAGGLGLVVLLDALVATLSGETPVRSDERMLPAPAVDRSALAQAREQGSDEFAFEVMYLLDADDAAVPELRERLDGLGDSLIVVGGGGLWNVHVHVNDVGAAVEAGMAAGRPHRISVTHFATQVAQQEHAFDVTATRRRAVVAVASGGGLAQLFREAGAGVLDGVPTRAPSAVDLVAAIRDAQAREVIVLPNDDIARALAEEAARLARAEGVAVAVLPTRASVQGLAALAVHDGERSFEDDVIAMTAAARATRHAEVTVAEEAALTSAGPCQPGDVLGFVEGDVADIGSDVFTVGAHIVDRLLMGGGELVTIVTGDDVEPSIGEQLSEYLSATRPGVETVVYHGGQRTYPLLLGVE
ncbi:MAG: DAK2 domain-containing protein [Actinomycetes bacterium]